MRMTAAVMYEQGLPAPFATSRPFHVEQVELEGPGPGEVLVEVRGAGLCHSDLTVVKGQRPRPLPTVGGHEGAGIVREVGADVTEFQPGDHVVMTGVAGCGKCRVCLMGRPGICENVIQARAEGVLTNGHRRLKSLAGNYINHYTGVSVFAQYAVVMPQSIIKIDKSVPFDVAAILGCGVMTGAGAVFNSAQVRPGSSVAVFGLGGVGLSAVMAAKESGAAIIVGIDVLPGKFDLARAVGVTHCFTPDQPNVIEEIRSLSNGGVDHAFEISGNLGALDMAQKIIYRTGEVVGVGVNKVDAVFTIPHLPWIYHEKVYRGSMLGGGEPKKDIPRYVDLMMKGRMPIDKLCSQQMAFDDINQALDNLQKGSVVRQVLLPHGPGTNVA